MQSFDGVPRRQPDHDDPIVWPEPNELSEWWTQVMRTDAERPPEAAGEGRA